MDIMSFTMLTNQEHAGLAALNALPAQLPPLPAHLAMSPRTELLELMPLAAKLAYVKLDTTPLLMDHAFNLTVMLILSALNANPALSFAFNALPQRTELSSSPKASVFVWTASMPTPRTTVLPAQLDAESAHQLPTVPAASL